MHKNTFLITIENLALETIIGVLPKERKNKQRVLINAKISYKYKMCKPIKHSKMQHSMVDSDKAYLDYVAIRDFLILHLQSARYGLLEEALKGSIKALKGRFPAINSIWLCIKKPDILHDCIVGLQTKHVFKE